MGKVAKELNDCPFCGGKGTIKHRSLKGRHFTFGTQIFGNIHMFFAECTDCHYRTVEYPEKEAVITAWNANSSKIIGRLDS